MRLLLLGSLLVSIHAALHISFGAHPEDLSLFSADEFKCKDGLLQIRSSAVNDDYCDCMDGSDEPGTSACSNGRFFCLNKGHKSKTIPSSRVNDNICDCCDGTDEAAAAAAALGGPPPFCPDRCAEEGAIVRRELARRIELYEKGLAKRAEYAHKGQHMRQAIIHRRTELAGLIAAKDAELPARRARRDTLQQAVDDAERQHAAAAAAAAAATDGTAQPTPAGADGPGGEVVQAGADGAALDIGPAAPQPVQAEPAPPAGEPAADTPPALEPGPAAAAAAAEVAAAEAALAAAKAESEAAGAELKALEEERTKNDNEHKLATAVLGYDFAPDDAYLALYDKCFSTQIQQFTYEVCLFRRAVQKEGNNTLNLGTWGFWSSKGEKRSHTSVMHYVEGAACWNGPSRTMTVALLCGEEEHVVSVQEPNKCQYEMEFLTPLACSAAAAKRLRRELDAASADAPAAPRGEATGA